MYQMINVSRNRTIDHIIIMEAISRPGEVEFEDLVEPEVISVKVHAFVGGKPKPGAKPKKEKNPPINKASIIFKRSKLCDCGCQSVGHDLHHCFIGRKKGVAILDDERNLVLVNHYQHIARAFDNLAWRRKFWKVQCERYGEKSMLEWVALIPEKMKSRVDWL